MFRIIVNENNTEFPIACRRSPKEFPAWNYSEPFHSRDSISSLPAWTVTLKGKTWLERYEPRILSKHHNQDAVLKYNWNILVENRKTAHTPWACMYSLRTWYSVPDIEKLAIGIGIEMQILEQNQNGLVIPRVLTKLIGANQSLSLTTPLVWIYLNESYCIRNPCST